MDTLTAVLYEGEGPTAIFLHGIPGAEKNWDIAYRLRELGWRSLVISFRGTGNSGGVYDISAQPDDVQAAITYASQQWPTSKTVLIGYSLGTWATFITAQRDPRVQAVVSLGGFADFEDCILSDAFFTAALPFLAGATLQSLKIQWSKLGGDQNPMAVMRHFAQPLLIVHGTADDVVPAYNADALYAATGRKATRVLIEGTDHVFTHERKILVETVSDWLIQWLKTADSR
jgi:pimeloyl-ACP methyl ester carboxylesterase